MYTSLDLYGKENWLDQHRKDLVEAATRNRSLHPSRLATLNLPEKQERFQVLVYRVAYVLLLVLMVTLLAVDVVTAVSGALSGGGSGGIDLVR